MQQKKSFWLFAVCILFLFLNLISCGNGGGDDGTDTPTAASAAMITSVSADGPWGNIAIYRDGMNRVFGVGNWDEFDISSEDGSAFAADSPYDFIYLDGSSYGGNDLVVYLAAHMTEIETWVNNGGRLYINAATYSININAPFGVLIEDYPINTANAVDPSHPIFNGPFTPVGTTYTGDSFGHNRIVGTGLTNIIVDAADATKF